MKGKELAKCTGNLLYNVFMVSLAVQIGALYTWNEIPTVLKNVALTIIEVIK